MQISSVARQTSDDCCGNLLCLSHFISPSRKVENPLSQRVFYYAMKLFVFFYVLNLIMVGTDLVLYYRNYLLDKKAAETDEK